MGKRNANLNRHREVWLLSSGRLTSAISKTRADPIRSRKTAIIARISPSRSGTIRTAVELYAGVSKFSLTHPSSAIEWSLPGQVAPSAVAGGHPLSVVPGRTGIRLFWTLVGIGTIIARIKWIPAEVRALRPRRRRLGGN